MRSTHTFALMEVSPSTFEEVREKLAAAGYDHALISEGGKLHLDMQGVAFVLQDAPPVERIPRASELEYLRWFVKNADFGPASGEVVALMKQELMQKTGKNLPLGHNIADDDETSLDR